MEAIRTIPALRFEADESADDKTEDHVVGNKNKKRILKKAPDAPKRFKSAYICYVMDMMDEIKGEYAGEIKVLFLCEASV